MKLPLPVHDGPMNTRLFFLLAAALVATSLAACAPTVNRMPKYQKDTAQHFGDWSISPAKPCLIVGNSADVLASTDGAFSDNMIQIRLTFSAPLAGVPKASLSSYPVALPLEGATRSYAINLLYDPTTAAHLMQPDTFLTLTYQPLNQPQPLEVNFATRGLVHALAALRTTCR